MQSSIPSMVMAKVGAIGEATSVSKHCRDRTRYHRGAFATRTLDRLVQENVLRHSPIIRAAILYFLADGQRGSSTGPKINSSV